MPPKVSQSHQNREAFVPNRGKQVKERDKAALQGAVGAALQGCCSRCVEQVKWKAKYGKFKPLLTPRKCNGCQKHTVRATYHNLCHDCAKARKVCPKCQTPPQAAVGGAAGAEGADAAAPVQLTPEEVAERMAGLRERERRSVARAIERGVPPAEALSGTLGRGGTRDAGSGGGGGGGGGSDDDDEDDDADEEDDE